MIESHRMIWKIIMIVIFSFSKFELIDLFAEIVAKRQIDDCFWNFFFSDFIFIESSIMFAEISMKLWSEQNVMIFVIRLLFVSKRWFSHERFSRIELLQNRCFQKHFKNAFRRREFEKFRLFIERSIFFLM